MKPIVVANWKMYFDEEEAVKTAFEIYQKTRNVGVEIIICPNFLALPAVKSALRDSEIRLGGQNCAIALEGALTGEVSPKILKNYADWVIIGHSERRDYLHETDSMIAQKIHAALSAGLSPIVCIGEHLEEHDRKDLTRVLYEAEAAFFEVDKADAPKIVLAYEPVWAISTEEHGNAEMSCDYAGGVIKEIRKKLENIFDKDTSEKIRIIYGGSVNKDNIQNLSCDIFSGFLVGSASRNPDEFAEICKIVGGKK